MITAGIAAGVKKKWDVARRALELTISYMM
jgi:hypothetical protein